MSEATARQKFACPACGGEAQWDPGRKALVCPYCSTVSPAQEELQTAPTGAAILEHDLLRALESIPDQRRGWQAAKTQVRCQSCQAISVFDPERVGQRCDFCGSSALVPYEALREAFSPESLLPMKISVNQVRDAMRSWYKTRWFAPNKLKTNALTDQVKGVYIPYWTFDARVHADWRAESGDYYWDTETYRDSNGQTKTRQVREVRWYWTSGSLNHFFDDELVPASRGLHSGLLRRIEPFPTKELVPYNPGFLSGWVVERYQIDLLAAAKAARSRMESETRAMCASRVPGDTHRNLSVDSDFSGQTFKHILAPVWLLTYQFRTKTYQVLINGYTGSIAGEYPKSWVKILFAVLGVALVAGIIALLAQK